MVKGSVREYFDLIVVGGGMVGAAMALGAAQADFKVLLVERRRPKIEWDPRQAFDVRVSALTRASENILKNLGAWSGIQRRRYHPFVAMRVWDESAPGEVVFSAAEMHEDNLGYTVENSIIQAALWERIEQNEHVELCIGDSILALHENIQCAELLLEQRGKVRADLLVAADGAFSQIRDMAFIGLDTHDYEQCAIVGCVKTELSHQDTCWQRYRKDGPFAYLAMTDNVSSIAWYLPNAKKEWALSLNDADFAMEIEKASAGRLGKVIQVADRQAFPLIRRHAEHYVKAHLALIGDAAHTIHPQAGQGVNLGFLDMAALLDVIIEAKLQQKPIGKKSVLRRYERWRRGDNALVQRSMEGFDWMFKQDMELKTALRRGLLPLANKVGFMKNWLMGQALNGRDALPTLAKTYIDKSAAERKIG
ncbi:UbiH/UbiF/VisC/COQ6 family ubiquinone biosynthesis hydroxylase [Thiomicrorhabdus heinhorstiae]|uniref:UbiH/UbiF/VisC/COQ6 family ubiquinone biosynthesis hydroxylase n=1 Tax=Thiomicrorhabdus heinhorstiae TaxID=2748010 RepID=A0ABS0BYX3_9GAMM|nr:UbiH/UbiF/VisC/COQ6 family ubiquinone biosynthesis hydroxylase [Thiomicrorhabdus heinhorstiae]MBF6058283.1 UbiH/UbiF/VisC/COQ6 family ubiquinone biosynthesis hydroxylase [Thiomicrorhabdus heinhorstiae]